MKYAKRMLALALVALPVLAAAQGGSGAKGMQIVGQVPFSFMVGSRHVPAGECTAEFVTDNAKILAIRNVRAHVSLFTPAMPNQAKNASGAYALVFHKYGDKAFLAGIKLAGARTIYRIPESRAEAELRAQNLAGTEETLLAAAK